MGAIRSLAKDTVIYGASSIVGRFLNWCLVPLYTALFTKAEYGVVTYVYSLVAIGLIILTYGMETGFFRFASKEEGNGGEATVYSTAMMSLMASSSLFLIGVFCFLEPLTRLIRCGEHTDYTAMMAVTLALDAVTSIPFCLLRRHHRPIRFAALKLTGIAVNIGLNLYWLLLCPWLSGHGAGWGVPSWYNPDYGIGYIFLANLVSTVVTCLLLIPEFRMLNWRFDSALWRRMLRYSFPLLVLGVAGIMNQTIDKLLLPILVSDQATAMAQLGIYGANYKIAIVMVMFIQAFRFAFEPFIFAQDRKAGTAKLQSYADAMKYFVIFAMFIFLAVMFYLRFVRLLISPAYYQGLKIVPVVMIAEFFFGVSFNLSLWYKLTDRTHWGTIFTFIGLAVAVTLNMLLVPRIGYMGCAWAALASYGVMMVTNWAVGSVKYPIPYQTGRMALYFVSAMLLWGVAELTATGVVWLDTSLRTILLLLYLAGAWMAERKQLDFRKRITDNI